MAISNEEKNRRKSMKKDYLLANANVVRQSGFSDLPKKELEIQKKNYKLLDNISGFIKNNYLQTYYAIIDRSKIEQKQNEKLNEEMKATIVNMRDSIRDGLRDVSSSITRTLSGWFNTVTRPISDFLAPMMAIGTSVYKIYKLIKKSKDDSGKTFWGWLKDQFKKTIFMIGLGVGVVLGLVYEKIMLPINLIRKGLTGLSSAITNFKLIFSEAGWLGKLFTWFKKLSWIEKGIADVGAVSTVLRNVFNYFKSISEVVSSFIGNKISSIASVFKNSNMGGAIEEMIVPISKWWNSIKNFLFGARNVIGATGESTEVIGLFQKLGGWWNSIKNFLFGVSNVIGVTGETTETIGFIGKIGSGLNKIKGLVMAVVEFIPGLSQLFSGMATGFKMAGKLFVPLQILLSAIDFVKGFTSSQGTIVDKVFGGLKGMFEGIVKPLLYLIEVVGGWVNINTTGFADKVMSVLNPLFDLIMSPFRNIIDVISTIFSTKGDLWTKLSAGMSVFGDSIKNAFLTLINSVARLFNVEDLLKLLREQISNQNWIPSNVKDWMVSKLTPTSTTTSPTTSTSTGSGSISTSPRDSGSTWLGGGGDTSSSSPTPVTPASPAVTQAGNSTSVANTTTNNTSSNGLYQPSAEAQNWFKDLNTTNALLRQWLETNKVQPVTTNGKGNTVNAISSSNSSTQNNISPVALESIPTDIENLAVMFANKTWGLS